MAMQLALPAVGDDTRSARFISVVLLANREYVGEQRFAAAGHPYGVYSQSSRFGSLDLYAGPQPHA